MNSPIVARRLAAGKALLDSGRARLLEVVWLEGGGMALPFAKEVGIGGRDDEAPKDEFVACVVEAEAFWRSR